MASRRVMVQLDAELIERLDALASRLKTSRSDLLRRGAWAMIAAEEDALADRDLISAYRRQPLDAGLVQAAGRLAAQMSPDW